MFFKVLNDTFQSITNLYTIDFYTPRVLFLTPDASSQLQLLVHIDAIDL